MTGPDSWVVFHFCNKRGECCTSGKIHNANAATYRAFYDFGSCTDVLFDSQDPDESHQTVEIEHFGPVGLEAVRVNFRLKASADVFCEDPDALDGTIVLPGGANKRLRLICNTKIVSTF